MWRRLNGIGERQHMSQPTQSQLKDAEPPAAVWVQVAAAAALDQPGAQADRQQCGQHHDQHQPQRPRRVGHVALIPLETAALLVAESLLAPVAFGVGDRGVDTVRFRLRRNVFEKGANP